MSNKILRVIQWILIGLEWTQPINKSKNPLAIEDHTKNSCKNNIGQFIKIMNIYIYIIFPCDKLQLKFKD